MAKFDILYILLVVVLVVYNTYYITVGYKPVLSDLLISNSIIFVLCTAMYIRCKIE